MTLHAMFLGIDDYDDRAIQRLRCAQRDANELYGLFKNGMGLGERAHYLHQGASLRDVRQTLEAIGATIRAGERFLFYFAGHGYQSGDDQWLLLAGATRALAEKGSRAGQFRSSSGAT